LRIAVTTETFLPKIDGIVTMLTKTVECLRARGDEVLIFAPSGGPAEISGAEVVSVASVRFPLYPELRLAPPRASMRARIDAFRPDILHLFEPSLLGIGGLYYAKAFNIPAVISYHTNLPAYLRHYRLGFFEGPTWRLMRERHRRAELNLCTSNAMIEDLHRHGVERLALWERAVDAQQFHPNAYSMETRAVLSGGEPERTLLLYVGRLSAEKDVGALRAVLEEMPGVRLAIVGDGPVRQDLERHFQGTPTVFTGYLRGEALAAAYASADLFLMPSRTETLGLVLLEAMAAGCPVVACRAGGVPDAVEDGATGLLYDPERPRALVEAVAYALANPARMEAMRQCARTDVERYSWTFATEQLTRYYAQAIENRLPVRKAKPRRRQAPAQLTRRMALGALRWLLP
jgi:glycosyltransferase involved in cell wall biosynthesis